MGAPKPTLGFPSRTAAAIALHSAGLSNREIADRMGIEQKNVYSLLAGKGAQKRATRPAEQLGRTVLFPNDILVRLGPAAHARGITVNELARRLVETAVDDGLIDGILDDGEDVPGAKHA